MNGRRWAGSIVALVVAAGCAGGVAAPQPTPTPPPTRAPAALPAGSYASTAFRPPVTYALPDGWHIGDDTPDYLALQPVTSDALGIYLFRSPRPASQAAACPIASEPDVGTTAKDLVDWIRARPGLAVGDPVAVTVGGLAGLEIDLAIVDGWKVSCPFAEGLPTVPLFVAATDTGFRWVMAGSERLRLSVLDVADKGTVVVDIDAFDGSLMGAFLPVATPIVGSMKFGLP